MTKIPANRVAAIAGFLTGIGAAIAGIENALPSKWQDSAVAAVGIIGSIVTVLHFMSGSQKFDALQAQPRPVDSRPDDDTPNFAARVTGEVPVTGEEPI